MPAITDSHSVLPLRPAPPHRRGSWRGAGRLLWLICCALLLPLGTRANAPQIALSPLRVLIVGGGPDLQNNQVAIESNVRYVTRLLPTDTVHTTLFADGDSNHATVLYDDDPNKLSIGERILNLILYGDDDDSANPSHYRKPDVGGRLDGASQSTDIDRAFSQIEQENTPDAPRRALMLYFTGHGSSDRADLENNQYDLWGSDKGLSVRELARHIARLPGDVPVTLIMVQCFSGAFGNVIFEEGDPRGKPVDRDLAGFFATVKERVAAGCTSAINEADYHDFTSYFFAALTGRDRVGRRVIGADYNGDGRVGMDEAYCYTLIHDESIDVPVCTSDVFLRRFVDMDDSRVFRTPYSRVRSWATPAQRAALDGLSNLLHFSGEGRLNTAYRRMLDSSDPGQETSAMQREQSAIRHLEEIRREDRLILYRRFPELKMSRSSQRRAAEQAAVEQLTREADEGKWKDLLDAEMAIDEADQNVETQEIADSHLIRLVRLGKSVVLAHTLQQTGNPAIKARFDRLLESEGRSLLPPADTIAEKTVQQGY